MAWVGSCRGVLGEVVLGLGWIAVGLGCAVLGWALRVGLARMHALAHSCAHAGMRPRHAF